jgi:hypothetical protein
LKVTAELEGLEGIVKGFNNKLRKIKRYTVKGMQDVTLDLCSKAVQLAPVETGDLRGSGYSTVTETADEVVGEVGFTEEYAWQQHEDLSYKHPLGGQAKYLEQPLNENTDKYITHLKNSAENGWDGDL